MLEHRHRLFSLKGLQERLKNIVGKRNADHTLFDIIPNLGHIPNPVEDLNGYDRHWIIRAENESFHPGNSVLSSADLSDSVLDWARLHYPNSYSTQAIRLNMLINGWKITNQSIAKQNPQGWMELLQDESWKQFVPITDFSKPSN